MSRGRSTYGALLVAHHGIVRTTLDIEDDVPRQITTASGLPLPVAPEGVAGFRPFSRPNTQVVTNEQVYAIRDQEGL